jgi:ATP-dependent Clp protease adaptor protein ClpS
MSQSDSQGEIITKERTKTKEPPMYKVILLNDDYTTMEFVVMVLESVFKKSSNEANEIMLEVHTNGRGIAGVYTKEIAETKIAIVHHLARQNEFPLKCNMEPA